MNILVSIDNEYVEQLINLIFSIKMYNDEKINLYIVYDELSDENKSKIVEEIEKGNSDKVHFLYYKNEKIKFPMNLSHTSMNTYYRLYAPFMLDKDIDRILYLDCDIICNNNISELYNYDFNGKCIVGCLDKYISTYKENYINAGVYLINLDKYRELLTEDIINKEIVKNIENLEYQDQDILNTLLKNNITIIDDIYNYQVNSPKEERKLDYAALYHYITSDKPWKNSYSEPIKAIPYYTCLYKRGKVKEANDLAEEHYRNKLFNLYMAHLFKDNKNYSVDVIIPSYNQTDSIRKTLDSICKQELDGIKLTVLLIDDCSQEDYLPIVEEYKNKLNLKYYRMDQNSGVAGARQRGMDEGEGDFFTIIDSDDQYFSKYTIQFLYYAMIINNVDVVRSIFMEEEHGKVRAKLYRNDNIACHGKLYRKKFITDNNIRYLDLRGNEDTAYNALLESLGAKYYDLDVLTYRWCFNKESFTRKDEMYHEQDLYTFAKGFFWTAQQIEIRKEKIDKPEQKICDLLAKIYYRLNLCWFPQTKEQMLRFASKIYFICRKIRNINMKKYIEEYIEKKYDFVDPDFINDCLIQTQEYMFELEEYKKMSKSEKISLGQLFDRSKNDFSNKELTISKKLVLGKNVEIGKNLKIIGISNVHVGNKTIIEDNVTIITNKIPKNAEIRNKCYTKPVFIGENVFIGTNTIIMPGVTIRNNAYIEPGSVVFEDIDENCVACGNPCKILYKFDEKNNHIYDDDKIIETNSHKKTEV